MVGFHTLYSSGNVSAAMLHLRIITPADLTATVLQELADDPGVTHITVDRGAATEPPGDLVACEVVRASVNPLIRRLRSAGVSERGGITMTELAAVVSTAADRAQAEILTPEIDTIVWEEVSARTSDDSTFSVSFGVLMVLAGIIAAVAVLTNNPVLIVGAMIVSPDYGPMAALSVALVNRAYEPAWRSLRALALGFPMAALAALLLTLAARGLGRIPASYLASERPVTDLLIGANLTAFVVAFVAGAAGSLPSVGRSRVRLWGCSCRSPRSRPRPTSAWRWPWATCPRRASPCRSCWSTWRGSWPAGC